jgi:aspartate ammonia-lyase
MRPEQDLLGSKNISEDVYWGIHTERARSNFTVSRIRAIPLFIRSYAQVKKAAALANKELGYIKTKIADAIIAACDEIISGKFADQFPLDALQGGAGTSTNMNMNEVIANVALEFMHEAKGKYDIIHPLEHVNLHQSTNDTYPTALKVAAITALRTLSDVVARLQGAFQKKEKEFASVLKIGRTELQEAVPMTLGAEFSAFAEAFARDRWRVFKCEERLRTVNIGGTAIGTGICAPRKYIFLVIEKLREVTGYGLGRGENVLGETANADSFVEVAAILKAQASNLIKVAEDLRKLHMLGEISVPAVQAGSSIMPGKVNPVILEAVIQAGIKVIANDLIISEATSRGSLQINEFMPLLAHALLESLEILMNANVMFETQVSGITANKEICLKRFNESESLITAFVPHLGYERATGIVKDFHKEGKESMREYLEEKLGTDFVAKILHPDNLLALGYKEEKEGQ